MTELFMKLVEAIVRIAVALETIGQNLPGSAPPLKTEAGLPADPATPVTTETTEVPSLQTEQVQVNPQTAGVAASPVNESGAAEPQNPQQPGTTALPQTGDAGTWDPTTADIQGSYRAKDKQAALSACLESLGIIAAKSWTWAKKHRAILDHVAQFGATAQLTWENFEAQVKTLADAGKREIILAVVQELEGHQVVAQPNVNPANYQTILDRVNGTVLPSEQANPQTTGAANQNPDIITKNVDPATLQVQQPNTTAAQPTDYVPGTPVTTPEQLGAYARYLMASGVTPQVVQQSIAHIAQGITYVPAERVTEAHQALQVATGL